MSEPTGDDRQQSNPESQPEDSPAESRDHASDQVASDPSAPLWSDPTAPTPMASPMPPMPPMPAAGTPSAWVPDAPPASNPYAPPASNPYAQQTPAPPYAAPPAPPYGQPPAPPYGQQYAAYGQAPYGGAGSGSASNTSAIVLTIVSALATVTTCVIGIPSLIFGIMALSANSSDPVGSRQKSKTGWIIFAVNAGIVVLLAIVAIALLVIDGTSRSDLDFNSGY